MGEDLQVPDGESNARDSKRPRNHLTSNPWRVAGLSLVALAVLTAVAACGVLAGTWLQRNRDSSAIGQAHRAQHPPQFGGDLDPYGTRHGGPIRISYIGASVTRGWYVTSIEEGYPAESARMIATAQQRNVDWHVEALPGVRASLVRTWQLPRDQDMVVIHLVTNDFLHGTPLSVYQQDYLAVLKEIRTASPRAAFICLGDWGNVGAIDQAGILAYSYDQIVHRSCAAFGGVYVPLNQDFEVPGSRAPAGSRSLFGPARSSFHPNDYGNQLIAQSVVAGIEGNPPTEQAPTGPAIPAPVPVYPTPGPATPPESISGHESDSSPSPTPTPSATPS